jgi:hypothetical protein
MHVNSMIFQKIKISFFYSEEIPVYLPIVNAGFLKFFAASIRFTLILKKQEFKKDQFISLSAINL